MNRYCAPLLCLFLSVLVAGTASADGVIRDGMGAISSGRGGTNLGHFDNGAILHDNPAGMVNLRDRAIKELSVDSLLTEVRYSDPDNPETHGKRTPYTLPHVALIRKSDDDLWAFGLGVFAPAGFGAEYQLTNNGVAPGRTEYKYRSFAALGKVLPGLSCRVTDRLSVGGTLGLAMSHAELEAPYSLGGGPFAIMDLKGTGAAMCWSAGLQYELSERTMIGASYTSRSSFALDGRAMVNIPGVVRSHYDLEIDLVWPQSAGAGVRHQLSDRHAFSADVIWYDWSQAFDRLDMTLTDPNNPLIVLHDHLPLNWRDSVSMRLGYEHALCSRSVLRAGYVYHRNPVPAGTMTPFVPAILEHVISTGYGRQWSDCRFDVGYQFSFGTSREVGTSNIPGGDFDDSRIDASAHWLFVSFQQQF